jgi:hypothetical protein
VIRLYQAGADPVVQHTINQERVSELQAEANDYLTLIYTSL